MANDDEPYGNADVDIAVAAALKDCTVPLSTDFQDRSPIIVNETICSETVVHAASTSTALVKTVGFFRRLSHGDRLLFVAIGLLEPIGGLAEGKSGGHGLDVGSRSSRR